MSVAFRRDSDEDHKEPTFDIPIAPGPNLVTRRGLRLIEEHVATFEAAIAEESDEATVASLKRDLRYWHTRQATAELAPPPEDGLAGIGSRVAFRLSGRLRTITIVGGDEADPTEDRIGFQAPLAQALLGSEVGERIDFADKPEAIEIVAIEPAEEM